MRCPTLSELPSPPTGKNGWPWNEESAQLPDTMPDGRNWPRISVSTPSYNQGEFIEETIRSVLLQGYPDLEYFVMDGGSNDDSVDIIRKYEPWLTQWVSEKDNGQLPAVNRGWNISTGNLIGWLNSDDQYSLGAMRLVATCWAENPDVGLIHGQAVIIDQTGRSVGLSGRDTPIVDALKRGGNSIAQPSTFITRQTFESVGFLNEDMDMTADLYYWLITELSDLRFVFIPRILSLFRLHQASKTSSVVGFGRDTLKIAQLLENDKQKWGIKDFEIKSFKAAAYMACARDKLSIHKLSEFRLYFIRSIICHPRTALRQISPNSNSSWYYFLLAGWPRSTLLFCKRLALRVFGN